MIVEGGLCKEGGREIGTDNEGERELKCSTRIWFIVTAVKPPNTV
jgi:hypothetical protein